MNDSDRPLRGRARERSAIMALAVTISATSSGIWAPRSVAASVAEAVAPSPVVLASGAQPPVAGEAAIAPLPGGGVAVLLDAVDPAGGEVTGARLTLQDGAGTVLPGWPIALDGVECARAAPRPWPITPIVDAAGTTYLLCRPADGDGQAASGRWAYAFDGAGTLLAGWPVAITADVIDARASGDGVLALLLREPSEPEGDAPQVLRAWTASIARDGTMREGQAEELGDPAALLGSFLGPDGTAWVLQRATVDAPAGVSLLAFDGRGPRSGFPVRMEGRVSSLAFDAAGSARLVQFAGGARLVTVGLDGSSASSEAVSLPFTSAWTGAGPDTELAIAPLVASDDTTYLVGQRGRDRTIVHRIDWEGREVRGWPVKLDQGLEWRGRCPAGVSGCGVGRSLPVADPHGGLLLPLLARTGSGSTIAKLRPDGRREGGWPIHLGPGSRAWQLAVDHERSVFALGVGGGRTVLVTRDPYGETTIAGPMAGWSDPTRILEGRFTGVHASVDSKGHGHVVALGPSGVWYLTDRMGDWVAKRILPNRHDRLWSDASLALDEDDRVHIAVKADLPPEAPAPSPSGAIYYLTDAGRRRGDLSAPRPITPTNAIGPSLKAMGGHVMLAWAGYCWMPGGCRNHVRYQSEVGGRWVRSRLPRPGDRAHLRVAEDGTPRLTYLDATGQALLWAWGDRRTGGFTTEVVAVDRQAMIGGGQMVLDSRDRPLVAWTQDWWSGDLIATVSLSSRSISGRWRSREVAVSDDGLAALSIDTRDRAHLLIFDDHEIREVVVGERVATLLAVRVACTRSADLRIAGEGQDLLVYSTGGCEGTPGMIYVRRRL